MSFFCCFRHNKLPYGAQVTANKITELLPTRRILLKNGITEMITINIIFIFLSSFQSDNKNFYFEFEYHEQICLMKEARYESVLCAGNLYCFFSSRYYNTRLLVCLRIKRATNASSLEFQC